MNALDNHQMNSIFHSAQVQAASTSTLALESKTRRAPILAALLIASASLLGDASMAQPTGMPDATLSASMPLLTAMLQDEAEDTPSPWEPETLDTGVDLSEVATGDEPVAGEEEQVEQEASDSHAGHDHAEGDQPTRESGSAEAVKQRVTDAVSAQQRAAAQRGAPTVYSGGAPTEQLLVDNPKRGFISVEEKNSAKDFGNLSQGDQVDHSFELDVTGDGDVTVDRIQASCGCTVAHTEVVGEDGKAKPYLYGQPLKPGSKLLVKAKLDTKKKRDRMVTVLTLMSNDPRGSMQLRLMANVVPFLAVNPSSLNFGQLRPSDILSKDMEISSTAGEVFALTVDETMLPPELIVSLAPINPAEDGRAAKWKATVTLGPKIPEGARRSYTMQFHTDQLVEGGPVGPEQKPLYHTTVAYGVVSVSGQVSASPAYMSFGLMKSGQEISRTVRVENFDEEFTLTTPEVSLLGYNGDFEHPGAATIEVTEVKAGRSFDVKLTMVGPEGLKGTFRGKLSIAVGHPDKPFLMLPFTGVVRAASPSPRGSN